MNEAPDSGPIKKLERRQTLGRVGAALEALMDGASSLLFWVHSTADIPALLAGIDTAIAPVHLVGNFDPAEVAKALRDPRVLQRLHDLGGAPLVERIAPVQMAPCWTLMLAFPQASQPGLPHLGPQWNAARSVHHRIFGDRVEFAGEFNGMMCNRSDLQQPNPSADPVMARYAQELVQAQTVSTLTFAHQVRQLILFLLPLGQCNADVVAKHLGCDRRTITRKLTLENTGFHALVNEHRRRMVGQYLLDKSRPLAQVSSLLGFSAPSAFSRWYRSQFGTRARDA